MLKALIQRSLYLSEACGLDGSSSKRSGSSTTSATPSDIPTHSASCSSFAAAPAANITTRIGYSAICASALISLCARARTTTTQRAIRPFCDRAAVSSLVGSLPAEHHMDESPSSSLSLSLSSRMTTRAWLNGAALTLTQRVTAHLMQLPDRALIPTDAAAILFQLLRLIHHHHPQAAATSFFLVSNSQGESVRDGSVSSCTLPVSVPLPLQLGAALAKRIPSSSLVLWPTAQSLSALEILAEVATTTIMSPPSESNGSAAAAGAMSSILTLAADIALQLQQMRLAQLGEREAVTLLSCLASLGPLWSSHLQQQQQQQKLLSTHETAPSATSTSASVVPFRSLWESACQRCLTLLPRLSHPSSRSAITAALLRVTPCSWHTGSTGGTGGGGPASVASSSPSSPAYHALVRALAMEKALSGGHGGGSRGGDADSGFQGRGRGRGRGGRRQHDAVGGNDYAGGIAALSLQRQLFTLLDDAPMDSVLDHLSLVVRRAVRVVETERGRARCTTPSSTTPGTSALQREAGSMENHLVSPSLAVRASTMALSPSSSSLWTDEDESGVRSENPSTDYWTEQEEPESDQKIQDAGRLPFSAEEVSEGGEVNPKSKESQALTEVLQVLHPLLARHRVVQGRRPPLTTTNASSRALLFTFAQGLVALTCYAECRVLFVGSEAEEHQSSTVSTVNDHVLLPGGGGTRRRPVWGGRERRQRQQLALAWDDILVEVVEAVLTGLCDCFTLSLSEPPSPILEQQQQPPHLLLTSLPHRVILTLCGVLSLACRRGWLPRLDGGGSRERQLRLQFAELMGMYRSVLIREWKRETPEKSAETDADALGWSLVVLAQASALLHAWGPIRAGRGDATDHGHEHPSLHGDPPNPSQEKMDTMSEQQQQQQQQDKEIKEATLQQLLVRDLDATARDILQQLQRQADETNGREPVVHAGRTLLEAVRALCQFGDDACSGVELTPAAARMKKMDPTSTAAFDNSDSGAVAAVTAEQEPGRLVRTEVIHTVAELLLHHRRVIQNLDLGHVLRCIDALCTAATPPHGIWVARGAALQGKGGEDHRRDGLRAPMDQLYRHLLELLSSAPNIHQFLPLHVLVAFVLERAAAAVENEDEAGNDNSDYHHQGGQRKNTTSSSSSSSAAFFSLSAWRQTTLREVAASVPGSGSAVPLLPLDGLGLGRGVPSGVRIVAMAERRLTRGRWIPLCRSATAAAMPSHVKEEETNLLGSTFSVKSPSTAVGMHTTPAQSARHLHDHPQQPPQHHKGPPSITTGVMPAAPRWNLKWSNGQWRGRACLPDSLFDVFVRLVLHRYRPLHSTAAIPPPGAAGRQPASHGLLSRTDTLALLLFFEERAEDPEALERAFTILQTRRLGQEVALLPRRRPSLSTRSRSGNVGMDDNDDDDDGCHGSNNNNNNNSDCETRVTTNTAATVEHQNQTTEGTERRSPPTLPAFGLLSLLTHAQTLSKAQRFVSVSVGLTLLEALESPAVMSQLESIADLLPVAAFLSDDLCVELRFTKRLAAAVQRRAMELSVGWGAARGSASFTVEPTPREMGLLIGHLICADVDPEEEMLASFRLFAASRQPTWSL